MKFRKLIAAASSSAIAAAEEYDVYLDYETTYAQNFVFVNGSGFGFASAPYSIYPPSKYPNSTLSTTISGDGTYTFNTDKGLWDYLKTPSRMYFDCEIFDGEEKIWRIFIYTDIPVDEGEVDVSASVIIDGEVVTTNENIAKERRPVNCASFPNMNGKDKLVYSYYILDIDREEGTPP